MHTPSPQVLLLAGNHEYYGTSRKAGRAWLTGVCASLPNVVFLDAASSDGSVRINGYRILGATLWTRIPNDGLVRKVAAGEPLPVACSRLSSRWCDATSLTRCGTVALWCCTVAVALVKN